MLPKWKRPFLFLLLLSALVIATDYNLSGVTYDSNLSAIEAKIALQMPANTTTQAEYESYLANHTLVVIGEGMDLTERLLLVGSNTPWLSMARQTNDTAEAISSIQGGNYSIVILMGGPYQDTATAYAIDQGWLNQTSGVEGGFIIQNGKSPSGTIVLSVSDRSGFTNESLRRDGVDYSPLSAIIPKEYVPIAATGISFILLSLINIFYNAIQFKSLDLGRKGKKIGEANLMVAGINMAEPLSMAAASIVLGVAITWEYFPRDFLGWIGICTAIALLGAIIHELTHKLFSVIFKIKIEYRFWAAGSALTLLSSYLGNAFAIQGFLLEEISPDVEKWKVGLMKLSAPVMSAAIMILFAYLNYNNPSKIYQIIYSISGLWAMVEMLPFSSLDGKDIKEWNGTIWTIVFFLIMISYLATNFLL